jgi:uncharacterized protein (TIGR03437 family)
MTIRLAMVVGMCWAAATQAASFVNVSAASGGTAIAPDSIASAVMDTDLDTDTVTASGLPLVTLPTTLGGFSVQVVDSAGTARLAALYSVSPGTITYLVPAETTAGSATVNVLRDGTPTGLSAPADIEPVTPALFSANTDGQGVAFATAVAVAIPGTRQAPVKVFQCGEQPGSCQAAPINPGLDRPVRLTFYGTGIRAARAISVTIGGMDVQVLSVAQAAYPGMDEITVPLVLALRGAGLVDVVVTADGVASNAVQVAVQ